MIKYFSLYFNKKFPLNFVVVDIIMNYELQKVKETISCLLKSTSGE